jgi:predicted small secreted protein
MNKTALMNLRRIDLRMLAVLVLALVLAACNNGGGPKY